MLLKPTIFGLLGVSLLISRSFEDGALYDGPRQVRRDYVATVIAGGSGMNKRLLVNGVGITPEYAAGSRRRATGFARV